MIELIQGNAADRIAEQLDQGYRWSYCLTSPPYYGLIDYGHPGQLGHEPSADEYIEAIAHVFDLVYQGMRDAGVMWLNIGDTRSNYSMIRGRGRRGDASDRRRPEPGTRQTGLIGIPHRLLERLKLQGWHHHQTYIWWRGDGNSSQPQDGRAIDTHEYIYVLGKSHQHRPQLAHLPLSTSVIVCPPERNVSFPCKMPYRVAQRLLSTAIHDQATVIDPFIGSGTTAIAAHHRGFDVIGIDLDISPAQATTSQLQGVLAL